MYEPNVVGDWQEYDEHAGLRVRVHRLEAAEPPRGRDDAAEGLAYFRLRVTVENRGDRHLGVHLEDGQIDVRIGPDGESAFIDWRNSQFIEGFDVYPLRRATAVLYAAGPGGVPGAGGRPDPAAGRRGVGRPSAVGGRYRTAEESGPSAPARRGRAWPAR